jgi:hypothetical protein
MAQLADLLDQVSAGKADASAAAGRIRKMKLNPKTYSPTLAECMGGSDDPHGPDQDDDGHELSEALHGGRITMDQYKVLYPAVIEALNAAKPKPSK